jgi:hypothetical protein
LKAKASNRVHLIWKVKSEKPIFKVTEEKIDMKSKNYFAIYHAFLAAVQLLPFFLAGVSTQANGLSVSGSRYVWSARYLQPHLQHPAPNDSYAPPRSPGWHEEAGN